MKKIVLTGGGTAGHVTPNLALLPSLQERGYEIHYIGSYNGIEKKLIENAGIPYDGISSGKLRRYFDIKNFSDPFRVIKGYAEARSPASHPWVWSSHCRHPLTAAPLKAAGPAVSLMF